MKFKMQLQLIDFDLNGYIRTLEDKIQEDTTKAARSWVYTVLQIIPTWSRASRATFEALANSAGISVPYGPLRAAKNRTALGRQNSRGGIDRQGHVFFFYYETTLRYLEYNQYNVATPGPPPQPFGELINPTPYRFLEAGQRDFQSFAKTVRLPNPALFISGRRI